MSDERGRPAARGRGAALGPEIVAAAERLLEDTTVGAAVTLRAIARETGIAAPSIYTHFADRDAVLDAVVERGFAALATECEAALSDVDDPTDALAALARTYLQFARTQPGRYRVLFERPPRPDGRRPTYVEGVRAFALLRAVLERALGRGADVELEAQLVWAALHGIATLLPATPGFPWLEADVLVAGLVERTAGAAARRRATG